MAKKYKGMLSLQFILPNVILLIVVWAVVSQFYAHVVTPFAEDFMRERRIRMTGGAGAIGTITDEIKERPLLVIIKDAEPMWEIIFCIWGLLFLGYKFYQISQERRVLREDFLRLEPGERIIPENVAEHFTALKALVEDRPRLRDRLLPKALLAGLHRFNASHSIQDGATAVRETAERVGDDLDSSLSLVRYIAWAIPAIGFVGTVRGIGEALNYADQAIKGDLTEVTTGLGLAFNSTYVGLALCIVLMYVLYLAQSTLESLISQVKSYCDEHLIEVMRTPAHAEARRNTWESEAESP